MSITFYQLGELISKKVGCDISDIEISINDLVGGGGYRDLYPSETYSKIEDETLMINAPGHSNVRLAIKHIEDPEYIDRIIDAYFLDIKPTDIKVYRSISTVTKFDQDSAAAIVYIPWHSAYKFEQNEPGEAFLSIACYFDHCLEKAHFRYEIVSYGLSRQRLKDLPEWLNNVATSYDIFKNPTNKHVRGVNFCHVDGLPYEGDNLYLFEKEDIGYIKLCDSWIQSTYNWIKTNIKTLPKEIQNEWQFYLQIE